MDVRIFRRILPSFLHSLTFDVKSAPMLQCEGCNNWLSLFRSSLPALTLLVLDLNSVSLSLAGSTSAAST